MKKLTSAQAFGIYLGFLSRRSGIGMTTNWIFPQPVNAFEKIGFGLQIFFASRIILHSVFYAHPPPRGDAAVIFGLEQTHHRGH
jgi:hypothetical protein